MRNQPEFGVKSVQDQTLWLIKAPQLHFQLVFPPTLWRWWTLVSLDVTSMAFTSNVAGSAQPTSSIPEFSSAFATTTALSTTASLWSMAAHSLSSMQTLFLTRFPSPQLSATEMTRAKPTRRHSYEALEAAAAGTLVDYWLTMAPTCLFFSFFLIFWVLLLLSMCVACGHWLFSVSVPTSVFLERSDFYCLLEVEEGCGLIMVMTPTLHIHRWWNREELIGTYFILNFFWGVWDRHRG